MKILTKGVKQRAKRFFARTWRRTDPVLDLFDPGRTRCLPPDLDLIEGYRERFTDTARVFHVFLKRCRTIRSGRGEAPVAVVVMPWFGTPCPWYAIAIGLGLARRGRPVVFVWHDLVFPEPSAYLDSQNEEIGRVMRRLSSRFPVLRVSEQSEQPEQPGEGPADEKLLDRLAEANLTWSLRGADPTEKDARLGEHMRRRLAEALPRVRALMHRNRFRYAIVSGGVLLPSGLYLETGSQAGVRVATFDAGLGWTAVDTHGVAAQQTALARAFESLSAELDGRAGVAIEAAREEFHKRRSGLDQTRYQLTGAGGRPIATPNSVLIPLSVIFDTAALGRHHIFADSREWLVDTITALLRQTSDPILVRQHPSERHVIERSRFDVRTILNESFGSNPQVKFIAAEDPHSTYDLLDAARLVLPFVSTIGIEAAALEKPVIVSGSVYYAGLGFVWAPSSRDDYFEVLGRGARGELPMLPDQAERAWLCYYLNAVCSRVWTNFTCQPPDFWRWVTRHPDELFHDPGVDDILTSIDQDVPLPLLRHYRRQESSSAPEAVASGTPDQGSPSVGGALGSNLFPVHEPPD